MYDTHKRSNEPIFWGLFGVGGTWTALFLPVTILVLLLLPAFGAEAGSNVWRWIAETVLGRLFLLVSIVLGLWHGMHRIHHTLHDFKIHSSLVCYGSALVFSVIALVLIII